MKPDAQARLDAYLHMKLHSPEEFYQSEHPFWKRELATMGISRADLKPSYYFDFAEQSKFGRLLSWLTYPVALMLGRHYFYVVVIVHAAISMVIDSLVALHTMDYWRAKLKSAEWDHLRVTPQPDSVFVDMLFALAQLREFKLLGFDVAKRTVSATMVLLAFVALAFIIVLLPLSIAFLILMGSFTASVIDIFEMLLILWIWKVIIWPTHESVWRIRAMQAVAAWAATIAPEHASAIAVALGYVFAYWLMISAILVGDIVLANASFSSNYLPGVLASIGLFIALGSIAWTVNWLVIRYAMRGIVRRISQ